VADCSATVALGSSGALGTAVPAYGVAVPASLLTKPTTGAVLSLGQHPVARLLTLPPCAAATSVHSRCFCETTTTEAHMPCSCFFPCPCSGLHACDTQVAAQASGGDNTVAASAAPDAFAGGAETTLDPVLARASPAVEASARMGGASRHGACPGHSLMLPAGARCLLPVVIASGAGSDSGCGAVSATLSGLEAPTNAGGSCSTGVEAPAAGFIYFASPGARKMWIRAIVAPISAAETGRTAETKAEAHAGAGSGKSAPRAAVAPAGAPVRVIGFVPTLETIAAAGRGAPLLWPLQSSFA